MHKEAIWRPRCNRSAMASIVAFLGLQAAVVLFLLLHDWVNLGSLNNLAAIHGEDQLLRRVFVTLLPSVPVAIGLFYSARYFGQSYPHWLEILLWITYGVLLIGDTSRLVASPTCFCRIRSELRVIELSLPGRTPSAATQWDGSQYAPYPVSSRHRGNTGRALLQRSNGGSPLVHSEIAVTRFPELAFVQIVSRDTATQAGSRHPRCPRRIHPGGDEYSASPGVHQDCRYAGGYRSLFVAACRWLGSPPSAPPANLVVSADSATASHLCRRSL